MKTLHLCTEAAAAKQIAKGKKASSQDKEGANNAAVDNASTQLQGESMSAAPEESKEADQTQNAELKLSTERQLSLEQTKQLQPQIDDGLDFANRGFLWFLRIDRQVYTLIGSNLLLL